MSKTSMKDIANILNVSIATVSIVLAGKDKDGRVSKVLAQKIRNLALDLNYERNNLARGLRVGASKTIGLIVADISNPFFAKLAFHIQEYAEYLGYTVIIANSNEDEHKMRRMIHTLSSSRVDGFIIVPTENGEALIADLAKRSTPIVLVDRYYKNLKVSHVVVNNYESSLMVTNHLIERAYKRIALITYTNQMSHMMDRKNGYIEAVKAAGIYDPNLIKPVNYENLIEDIDRVTNELLLEGTVDSFYFTANTIAVNSYKIIQRKDPNLMKRAGIVCFDKSEAFSLLEDPPKHICQPILEMGHTSVDLLLEQIGNKDYQTVQIQLQTAIE